MKTPTSNPILLITAAALMTAATSSSRAVDFYPITSVTSSTSAMDFFLVDNLIEGPGLGFDINEPHDRASGLTWVTNAPNGGAGDYFAPLPDPAPVLVFDLGSDVPLGEISFWGYADTNANGANQFSIRFATDAEGNAAFGTSITYNPTFNPTQPATPRQSFPFTETVVARYVELTPLDNFFGINPPGGDRVGLGEVAFEMAQVDGPNISTPAELAIDLAPDQPTDFDVPVANSGDEDLNITGTAIIGPNSAAFTIVTVVTPVEPVSTENISIQFDPTGLNGEISATLQITSNDPDTPTAEVLLTGSLPEAGPDISVPAEVALSAGGAAQNLIVSVANVGSAPLSISGTSLSGTDSGAFTVNSTPASIAPETSADIEVAFDPSGLSDGPVSATLQINSNDPDTPAADVLLTGSISATFYPITAIATPNMVEGNAGPNPLVNLIQGPGVGFDAEAPHDNIGGTWYTDAPGGFPSNYIEVNPGSEDIIIDLGQDVDISELSMWGYAATNGNGIREFSLLFATNAEGGADGLGDEDFGASIIYNPTFEALLDPIPRQSFEFEETAFARYVQITVLSNFFDMVIGGDRIGMGEIAFANVAPISSIPFAITEIEFDGTDVTLTFNSRPGVTYTAWRSTTMLPGTWAELDDNVVSQGDVTVFIDETLGDGLPKFPIPERVFYRFTLAQ